MVTLNPLKRPKILHLGKYDYHSKEAGGVESVLKSYSEHLMNDFCQIVIVFSTAVRKKTERIENGVKLILIPAHLTAGYAPVNFLLFFQLRKVIKNFSPDIIHVHMPGLMPFFCLHELKKRKTIVHWHADVEGTRVSKNILFPFYKALEQRLLKIADAVIVTSLNYLDSSRSLKKFKKKCSVIPIGITETRKTISFEKITSPGIKNFLKNRSLILSVGRLAYYKGYSYLVTSMRGMAHDNVALIIAGHGPERQTLEKIIVQYNLQEKVFLPGKISESDKKALLSKASIFCLPSIDRAEAFGLSLVEAMEYGIPLITTDVKGSGMNYVNIHHQTGIKVMPSSSRQLSDALNKLLNNVELLERFGNNGYQRFKDHFKAGSVASQIKQQYLKLLSH